jgi:hypothetical protein
MNSKFCSARGSASIPPQPLKHSIDLGTLVSVLVQAEQEQRIWVGDFADEQVEISADLFQVIQAARLFRRAA